MIKLVREIGDSPQPFKNCSGHLNGPWSLKSFDHSTVMWLKWKILIFIGDVRSIFRIVLPGDLMTHLIDQVAQERLPDESSSSSLSSSGVLSFKTICKCYWSHHALTIVAWSIATIYRVKSDSADKVLNFLTSNNLFQTAIWYKHSAFS